MRARCVEFAGNYTIQRRAEVPADGRPPDHDKRRLVPRARLGGQRCNRGQNRTTNAEAEICLVRDEITASRFQSRRQRASFAAVKAHNVPFFRAMFKFLETLVVTLQ